MTVTAEGRFVKSVKISELKPGNTVRILTDDGQLLAITRTTGGNLKGGRLFGVNIGTDSIITQLLRRMRHAPNDLWVTNEVRVGEPVKYGTVLDILDYAENKIPALPSTEPIQAIQL